MDSNVKRFFVSSGEATEAWDDLDRHTATTRQMRPIMVVDRFDVLFCKLQVQQQPLTMDLALYQRGPAVGY